MPESIAATPLKLNLGSGQNPRAGYVNVDKNGSADVNWDLERFPWPWPDSSVDEIVLHHVLEHLGETVESFFGVIKELYRVCRHGAVIQIAVPHPRHDTFLADPTHVRAFTAESFMLYSKAMCRQWQKEGVPTSPLGLYLDVDFNVTHIQFDLEQPWAAQYDAKQITQEQLLQAAKQLNNVVKQINIRWMVNKP
jgi:hypothetical protein